MNDGNALAARALTVCRNQLFFENRFLEQALFRLTFKEGEAVCFGSEGSHLFYQTEYVLKRYMKEPKELMFDYLHTVLHCLYQHPFFVPQKQGIYWNLATDIAAECILEEMVPEDGEGFTSGERLCREIIERIRDKIHGMSAQKIFIFLCGDLQKKEDFFDFFGMEFEEVSAAFWRDDHSLWYKADFCLTNKENNFSGFSDDCEREKVEQKQLQQIWKGVAERVLMEAQSFAKPIRGDIAGDMLKTLTLLTRENYDYSAFLLKFATHLEERIQIDMDEFDYIFYTYGLQLDKRMPLIEPLEYKEKYLLREFVIAIDTSASCEGELVEKFLVKTYNILRQTESFTLRVNIHIIQCDAKIQEDVTIRAEKDLEDYISHLTLKGFGGTDFCPVFEYVEEMFKTGELRRLEGLLYFTDGYGKFPAKPPKYKTAFIFLGQEEEVKVPAWAMKVYLEREALT